MKKKREKEMQAFLGWLDYMSEGPNGIGSSYGWGWAVTDKYFRDLPEYNSGKVKAKWVQEFEKELDRRMSTPGAGCLTYNVAVGVMEALCKSDNSAYPDFDLL